MSQNPVVDMTKEDVEEQRLEDFVIMPDGTVTVFMVWWGGLSRSTMVQVSYPHDINMGMLGRCHMWLRHQEDFLTYVDDNSQPNGWSADLSGPTSYFLGKFTTLQTPKVGSSHYEEHLSRFVVDEFNCVQREHGRGTCSNGSQLDEET